VGRRLAGLPSCLVLRAAFPSFPRLINCPFSLVCTVPYMSLALLIIISSPVGPLILFRPSWTVRKIGAAFPPLFISISSLTHFLTLRPGPAFVFFSFLERRLSSPLFTGQSRAPPPFFPPVHVRLVFLFYCSWLDENSLSPPLLLFFFLSILFSFWPIFRVHFTFSSISHAALCARRSFFWLGLCSVPLLLNSAFLPGWPPFLLHTSARGLPPSAPPQFSLPPPTL